MLSVLLTLGRGCRREGAARPVRAGTIAGPRTNASTQAIESQIEIAQSRVIVRPAAELPVELAVRLGDRQIVD
jgi:hypothetical protein